MARNRTNEIDGELLKTVGLCGEQQRYSPQLVKIHFVDETVLQTKINSCFCVAVL
jgi:hypothetical protein